MTPEQIAQIILLVLTGLFGGGLSGAAITRARASQDQRNYKALFQESTEKLVKQQERIDELEADRKQQAIEITDIKARLSILAGERDLERKRYQVERDEVMMERGKISAQVELLQREIEQMRADLKDLRAKNDELQKTNKQLEEYREVAREQKRQLDEAHSKMRQMEVDNQRLKDRVKFLASQLTPPPPTPNVLPKTGTDE